MVKGLTVGSCRRKESPDPALSPSRGSRKLRADTEVSAYLVPVRLVRLLREPRYPEDLCGLQEAAKGTLMHVHLPVIDELHQRVQVAERYILKYYHRVFARGALQNGDQRGRRRRRRDNFSH